MQQLCCTALRCAGACKPDASRATAAGAEAAHARTADERYAKVTAARKIPSFAMSAQTLLGWSLQLKDFGIPCAGNLSRQTGMRCSPFSKMNLQEIRHARRL